MRTLNRQLLEVCAAWPTGGGYRFEPAPRAPDSPVNPRDPVYDGVREDLVVAGEIVARGSGGPTYCCGISFAAWWRAWQRAGGSALDPEQLRAMLAEWFCPEMGHPGVAQALSARGLGEIVPTSRTRAGDLCQLWRSVDLHHPSGHSAVLLGWEEGGQVLRYWSSQPATDGVGVHRERVGSGWTLHMVRPRAP